MNSLKKAELESLKILLTLFFHRMVKFCLLKEPMDVLLLRPKKELKNKDLEVEL